MCFIVETAPGKVTEVDGPVARCDLESKRVAARKETKENGGFRSSIFRIGATSACHVTHD